LSEMYHPILRPGAQRQLKSIGEVDLVIGLPTYKNAQAAAHVARTVLAGARQHYPHLRTVLINADAGLEATTRQAVAAQAGNNGFKDSVVTGRYDGLLGQGSAIAALLDAALALDAKAVVVLDSQTQTITPNWVAGLAHLILENKADLVTSRYRWPLPGGGLSDLIVYPLFRALWGQSVRHPAAPDFALSPALAAAVLDEDIWETEAATFGLPLWLSTHAILGPWRTAQSALGEKQLVQTPPHATTSQARRRIVQRHAAQWQVQFQTVVSALLRQVYDYRLQWANITTFNSVSTLTEFMSPVSFAETTSALDLDTTLLLDELPLGWIEYRSLWQQVLTAKNLTSIEALAALPPDRFYFPADLWARVIYDFAVVFNKGDCDPSQIVTSLWPLYQGRLAAFWQEVAGLSVVGYEGTVAAQAVEFEETRPYLADRWQAYQPV
jgi:glucosylglycerate synthase